MAGPPTGRVLGVDVGTVRIGLAVSDPAGVVATPLATLAVDPGADDEEGRSTGRWAAALAVQLVTVAREQACEAVVVGLPRALSGRDTAATGLARQVAAALREQGLPVELWDERLSSVEAERILLGTGRRRAQRREQRDRVAAAIILQGWLDARAR
jgi:putative Holliday junction resolvase